MIALTSQQRRELRAQAHSLHPVVSVGQHGLTPQVMHEIDGALRAHGLIKVRVFSEDRARRETMLARIADELAAAPVQHLGKLLILWRPLEEKAVKPAARPARKPRKERARGVSKRPQDKRMLREPRELRAARRRAPAPSAEDARTAPDSRRIRRGAVKTLQQTTADPPKTRQRRAVSPDTIARTPSGKSAPNPRRRRRAG